MVKPLLLVLTDIQDAKARAFVKMVLEGAGHRVIEAAGRAQVNALLSNGLDPDLLLCEASPANSSETSQFRQLFEVGSRGQGLPDYEIGRAGSAQRSR